MARAFIYDQIAAIDPVKGKGPLLEQIGLVEAQALGIGGQIYGARADLIILDDCVTLSNSGEYEKQIRWIQQEVLTRIGPTGKLLIVGTRVDPIDMYRELRTNDRYPEGKSPWTYLAMPAVLEFDENPENWVTLWPRSDRPWSGDPVDPDEDGFFPRWDGTRLKLPSFIS